jgi:hypothetical protein
MLAVAMLAVAACSTSGTTTPRAPTAGSAETDAPITTPGASGASIGDPAASATIDPGSPIAPAVELPPPGSGELVVPKPGQLDVREIPAELLEAEVDGRSVTLRITFTSGVEPCYVLDSIVVNRGDRTFAVALRQGHPPGDLVCIDIAVSKHALVDLGDLEPGTYTITDAAGGAPPIEVVVR